MDRGAVADQSGPLGLNERIDLANRVTRGFLACALDHGFFHADLHEGNMILAPDGRLVLVDFGIMGRIGDAGADLPRGDPEGLSWSATTSVSEVHFEAGYVPANHSMDDFAQALRSVGEPIFGKDATEVSMARVLLQLFDITRQFGMHLRPELILLQKTMVQVEGVARSIDPAHNIWQAAKPVVERWSAARVRAGGPEEAGGGDGARGDGTVAPAAGDAGRSWTKHSIAPRTTCSAPVVVKAHDGWGWALTGFAIAAASAAGLWFVLIYKP
jgi:hypothetical protein